jgi:hypothetical protein
VQPTMPQRTRAAWQRGVPRPDSSRLPEVEGATPATKPLTPSPCGDFPRAGAAGSPADGQRQLVVAIARSRQAAAAARPPEATTLVAAPCRRPLIAAVPYTRHPVRTDHGRQCTNRSRAPDACGHLCARVCGEQGLEPRLTTGNHPGTNGHVARPNRPRKDATVKQASDQTYQPLTAHLRACQMADNCAKRLNTRTGLPPDEDICQGWQKDPERLTVTPGHHTLGLNT